MKHLLLATVPLLFSSVALAQPDPNVANMVPVAPANMAPAAPRIPQDTPANAARYFVSSLSAPWEGNLAMAVAGARIGYYGDDIWEKVRKEIYPFNIGNNLKVDDVTVDSQNAKDASVTITAHREFQGTVGVRGEKYTLQLRREVMPLPGAGEGQEVWRVVPLPTETVLNGTLSQLPLLSLAATLALRDPQLVSLLQEHLSMSQLKQLGLGAMQFVQDYEEVYAFDDAARQRALTPYVKNTQLFTIPGAKDEKWHFNDLLANKSLASLAAPARTVLFYDGDATSTESLHFRFGGKTLICFADGHVAALTKERLQDIIWNPPL